MSRPSEPLRRWIAVPTERGPLTEIADEIDATALIREEVAREFEQRIQAAEVARDYVPRREVERAARAWEAKVRQERPVTDERLAIAGTLRRLARHGLPAEPESDEGGGPLAYSGSPPPGAGAGDAQSATASGGGTAPWGTGAPAAVGLMARRCEFARSGRRPAYGVGCRRAGTGTTRRPGGRGRCAPMATMPYHRRRLMGGWHDRPPPGGRRLDGGGGDAVE